MMNINELERLYDEACDVRDEYLLAYGLDNSEEYNRLTDICIMYQEKLLELGYFDSDSERLGAVPYNSEEDEDEDYE